MTHRPISSLLLYMQVVAVWALILAASIFSQWNDSNDQLATILLFGAGAITVPVYQLLVRVIDERKYAKFVAMAAAHPQQPAADASSATGRLTEAQAVDSRPAA